jgi:transcriptional regulator with XRE-family HTH domain
MFIGMTDNRQGRYYRYQPVRYFPDSDEDCGMSRKSKKEKRRPNYIKAWRKFRKLTQAQLADELGIAQGSLSDLENAQFDYVQGTLERIAKALRCEPSDLIGRPPDTSDIFRELVGGLDEAGQKRAIALLKALKDSEAA